MEMISWAEEMMPSVNKNPRARSTSLPGVRMVMAIFFSVLGSKLAPVSRISNGSSTATKSLVDRAFPCSNRVISVGDMLNLVDKDWVCLGFKIFGLFSGRAVQSCKLQFSG